MCVFYQPERTEPSKHGGGQEVWGVAEALLWEWRWISVRGDSREQNVLTFSVAEIIQFHLWNRINAKMFLSSIKFSC